MLKHLIGNDKVKTIFEDIRANIELRVMRPTVLAEGKLSYPLRSGGDFQHTKLLGLQTSHPGKTPPIHYDAHPVRGIIANGIERLTQAFLLIRVGTQKRQQRVTDHRSVR